MKKKQFSRSKWLLYFIFFSLSLMVACSSVGDKKSDSQASTERTTAAAADENILRVGVSTNAPPLIYKQGGEILGLEAELAHEFAKFMDKSVRFVEVKWEDQIPALLDKRTDIIMSGMSITKMRQIRISFSTPYFRTGQMALVHKKDINRFPQTYYGILGQAPLLKIGVIKGTTGEIFVRKNFGFQAKKISSFKTSKIAADALLRAQIDMLIHDGPIILMLAAENEAAGLTPLPSLLTEEYLAWGIRKNDVALLNSANRFIDHLNRDGSLNRIVKRWIPFMK